MLAEIEMLILQSLKALVTKPEMAIAELQALYSIFRDLKVITNGQTQSSDQKQA